MKEASARFFSQKSIISMFIPHKDTKPYTKKIIYKIISFISLWWLRRIYSSIQIAEILINRKYLSKSRTGNPFFYPSTIS